MNCLYCCALCGFKENKKMSVQDTIEELTEICIDLRHNIGSVDQKEKERIVLKHINKFADTGIRICDFQKGELSKFSSHLPPFEKSYLYFHYSAHNSDAAQYTPFFIG